jgi:hypothetical protein
MGPHPVKSIGAAGAKCGGVFHWISLKNECRSDKSVPARNAHENASGSPIWRLERASAGGVVAVALGSVRLRLIENAPDGPRAPPALGTAAEATIDLAGATRTRRGTIDGAAHVVIGQHVAGTDDHRTGTRQSPSVINHHYCNLRSGAKQKHIIKFLSCNLQCKLSWSWRICQARIKYMQ